MVSEEEKLRREVERLKAVLVQERMNGWIDGYQHAADKAKHFALAGYDDLVSRLQRSATACRTHISGAVN